MENVIQTQDLGKRYLHCTALRGLTMQIPKGSIYGLVGKNGAGKTTLIRILTGLQQPTSGQYSLYGVPHTDPDILRCRRRMGGSRGDPLPLSEHDRPGKSAAAIPGPGSAQRGQHPPAAGAGGPGTHWQ